MRHFFAASLITIFLLPGCSGFAALSVTKSDVVGRDVDSVINELSKKGIACGSKFTEKAVNSNRVSGSVNCGVKGTALMCPSSYGIYLSYDLLTNKVASLFKDERSNCF
jgi:hypothetical protein